MTRATPISLRLLEDHYAVCRLEPDAVVPTGLLAAELLSVTRTPTELSIVCRQSEGLPGQVEPGWRGLVVEGPLDFGEIGILAALATPLADAGVSIFVLSTYDTDYLLVKEKKLVLAIDSLRAAGHQVL